MPNGWITELARDPEKRVRRRLANRLRDLLEPGEPLSHEATATLLGLVAEGGGVQRAAIASLGVRSHVDTEPSLQTWDIAMDRVTTPGPPGRAAANTLGHLADTLEPGPHVDPVEAVHRVYTHHRERTWRVWSGVARPRPLRSGSRRRAAPVHARVQSGVAQGMARLRSGRAPRGLRALGAHGAHSERYLAVVGVTDNLSSEGDPPEAR